MWPCNMCKNRDTDCRDVTDTSIVCACSRSCPGWTERHRLGASPGWGAWRGGCPPRARGRPPLLPSASCWAPSCSHPGCATETACPPSRCRKRSELLTILTSCCVPSWMCQSCIAELGCPVLHCDGPSRLLARVPLLAAHGGVWPLPATDGALRCSLGCAAQCLRWCQPLACAVPCLAGWGVSPALAVCLIDEKFGVGFKTIALQPLDSALYPAGPRQKWRQTR